MYKRTKQAIIDNPPDSNIDICMFDAQYGRVEYQDISFAITTRTDSSGAQGIIESMKQNQQIEITEPIVLGWSRDNKGKVVNRHPVEVANCITVAKRETTQNYVVVPSNTKSGEQLCEIGGVIDISYPTSSSRRGRVQSNGTISPTLTCGCEHTHARIESFLIRKLTEKECFILMGLNENEIEIIRSVVSKSQCYKLAGNSIVVDVLVAIFRNLLTKYETPKFKQLELFQS